MHTDKSLLVIISSAPYSSSQFKEGLDLVLAACTFDREVSLLLQNDALYVLNEQQAPSNIGSKNINQMLKALPIYGLEEILIFSDSIEKKPNKDSSSELPVKWINSSMKSDLIRKNDLVLRF